MLVAVVIPVYNEAATLGVLVDRLVRTPPPPLPGPIAVGRCERLVVIVDDGSTDGTGEVVRQLGAEPGIMVVRHERNQGKGAALRTGFAEALRAGAEVLLVQDGDLEYDPADHAAVLAPILSGRADAVIGSRFLGGPHRVLYFWHSVANGVITMLSNVATNLNLTDIECCSKAMTRAVAERIEIEEARFGVEPELVAKLAAMRVRDGVEGTRGGARRLRIFEVPVSYAGRTYAEGKKIGWRDGVRALWCIGKYAVLSPRRGTRAR